MKTGFFIMKLWQTGNVGSHNIGRINANPKDGYTSYDEAEAALLELKKTDWEVREGGYDFTIMKLYWSEDGKLFEYSS